MVKPTKTKKIRGAHYEDVTIKFGNGAVKTFTEEDMGFLKYWQEYQGKYICSNFWGTKINISIASQNQLIVQPCNDSNEPMVL